MHNEESTMSGKKGTKNIEKKYLVIGGCSFVPNPQTSPKPPHTTMHSDDEHRNHSAMHSADDHRPPSQKQSMTSSSSPAPSTSTAVATAQSPPSSGLIDNRAKLNELERRKQQLLRLKQQCTTTFVCFYCHTHHELK